MAFQARHRDPLLDSETQALLERRGCELIGLVLVTLAVLAVLLLGSYAPDDPSWLSATDKPAENFLGRTGASVASPLMVISGLASWGLPLVLGVAGVRFLFHLGADRVPGRLIFAPLALALMSVYASTHVPPEAWSHSFGLGGLFGDTILGALLGFLPVNAAVGLRVAALTSALAAAWMLTYTLGFTRAELSAGLRYILRSIVFAYSSLLRLLTVIAVGTVRGTSAAARSMSERRAARRAERDFIDASAEESPRAAVLRPATARSEPPVTATGTPAHTGLLGRARALVSATPAADDDIDLGNWDDAGEDRVRARIVDAVRARVGDVQVARTMRVEPLETGQRPLNEPSATFPEDDFGDDIDMPAPELVDEATPLVARPLFETGRSADDGTGRRVVQHASRKAPAPSKRAKAEAQPSLFSDGAPRLRDPAPGPADRPRLDRTPSSVGRGARRKRTHARKRPG
jgi:S-DNA-T family DNA segregation ATPase FtsK/SpoIIIE